MSHYVDRWMDCLAPFYIHATDMRAGPFGFLQLLWAITNHLCNLHLKLQLQS